MALVGVNAARRYERSMLYHTKGALDAGSTVAELAEIFLPCILSRGIPAWLEGTALRLRRRIRGRSDRSEGADAVAPSPPWKRRRLLSRRSRRTGT